MSSMLEQAIVDAAALREAALKNAEQAIIEKYAPQIKEAVNSLLDDKGVLEEQSIAASAPEETPIEAPFAASPGADPNQTVEFTLTDDDKTWEFDLEKLKQEMSSEEGGMQEEEQETTDNLLSDLGLDQDEPGEEAALEPEPGTDEELALQEIMNILNDMTNTTEVLEEELVVDMGDVKHGSFVTDAGTRKHDLEMELAKKESTKYKEENEELEKKIKELSEALSVSKTKNKKILKIVEKLDSSLNETLLSNAKLLYCNRTLSDASLNERQKHKIVEAIARAKTPEEAKNLQETLKATVGTTKKDGPQSLSESVQRRSNLSGIMPRRKKPAQEHSFSDRMKKLAGIQ